MGKQVISDDTILMIETFLHFLDYKQQLLTIDPVYVFVANRKTNAVFWRVCTSFSK